MKTDAENSFILRVIVHPRLTEHVVYSIALILYGEYVFVHLC